MHMQWKGTLQTLTKMTCKLWLQPAASVWQIQHLFVIECVTSAPEKQAQKPLEILTWLCGQCIMEVGCSWIYQLLLTVCVCIWMFQRPVVEKKAAAESCGTLCLPGAQSPGFTTWSSSQTSYTKKAKVLDPHLPSLKKRKLSECKDKGSVLLL